MKSNDVLERKLRAQLLVASRVEGDRLMLADDVLAAALDGTRALTANERAALEGSPLTVRRLRQLSIERAAQAWSGSAGMLRAAESGVLRELATDDGHWVLHFLPQDGSWQVILKLAADAPFASQLMRDQPMLRVTDGGGGTVLQGRLDADGECESAWPFATAPAPHFQLAGARFAVEPITSGRR